MTSRRQPRIKYHSDDDDDDNDDDRIDDGNSTRRRRRTRPRDLSDDEEAPRRRRQHRQLSDEEENERYHARNKKEAKEKEYAKTRRYSDEDDVSDDQSKRRTNRKRADDDYRKNRRRRRDESDEEEDEEEEISRKSQKSRRRRVEYSDDEDEDEGREKRRLTRRRDSDDEQHSSRRKREGKKRYNRDEYVESEDDDDKYARRQSSGRNREERSRGGERSRRDEKEAEDRRSEKARRSDRYYSEEDDEEEEKPIRSITKKKGGKEDLEGRTSKRRSEKQTESDFEEDGNMDREQREAEVENRQPKKKSQISIITGKKKTEIVDDDDEANDLMKNRPKFEDLKGEDDEGVVDENEEQEEEANENPFAKYKTNNDMVEELVDDVKSEDNPFQKYRQDGTEEKEGQQEVASREQEEVSGSQQEVDGSKQADDDEETPQGDGQCENPFAKYKEPDVDRQSHQNEKGLSQGKVSVQNTGKQNPVFSSSSTKVSNQKDINIAKQVKGDEEEQQKDDKKKRRRNKDASASILDVINWKLGGEEKYEGSDTVPEIKDATYTSKLENEISTSMTVNDAGKALEESCEDESKGKDSVRNLDDEEEIVNSNADKQSNEEKVVDLKTKQDTAETKPLVNGCGEHEKDVKSLENGNLNSEKEEKKFTELDLADSLKYLNNLPDLSNLSKSSTLSNLMDTYLNNDNRKVQPGTLEKPKLKTVRDVDDMAKLEEDLKSIRQKNKKQPPPPVRSKPIAGTRTWEDPREQQRQKNKEKQWPPKEPPKDLGAYVVESYGQTDPYSKRLIKDIQRSKREEEEKKEAEKRAEIISENAEPVSTLRSTFATRVPKPRPGVLKPVSNVAEERSWIKHEKKEVVFDTPPDEPDWMKLIRNRRWKSTVKARFPCKTTDKTDFERRSTTPKNWRKLAKDKNALRMLSEIVGIGAEGEELFMRLATQRQKIEDEQEEIDKLTAEELMAYEVAREALGGDAAYSLQMDNPLPAARMRPILNSISSGGASSDTGELESLVNASVSASSAYPFTTSQLEAAYLTNQLLRLHPEEFRKLMSLERSRQATLRWQFSSDPFDSVHEHQSLPLEIALLASEEPRVTQAMKKILGIAQGDDSVFATPVPDSRPRRTRSDGGYSNSYYGGSESDGYESSHSVSSSSSFGGNLTRGRSFKKKGPAPPVKPRCRSVSPGMNHHPRQGTYDNHVLGNTLEVPKRFPKKMVKKHDDEREVQAHGLLTDEDLALSEEISKLQELTSNITRDINEELKDIEASISDRKKGFYEDSIRRDQLENKTKARDDIDVEEIASRREGFMQKDLQSSVNPNVRDGLPKTRHKVQRINSSAQLDAIFRRRRQISESDMEDNDDDANDSQQKQQQIDGNATAEMTNLIKDINDTFGIK